MNHEFETIIGYLIGSSNAEPLAKIDIKAQFRPEEDDRQSVLRNLNAAFLIALSGKSHPLFEKAAGYLNQLKGQPQFEKVVRFYNDGLKLILFEIEEECNKNRQFQEALNKAYSWVVNPSDILNHEGTRERLWQVFFPEGISLYKNRDEKITSLREKRRIKITQLNPSPIKNPSKEILFTSNILLTTPLDSDEVDNLKLPPHILERVRKVVKENQLHWYDHPIPIGIEHEKNEALHGLLGLDDALEFEKQRGTMERADRLNCVLSVSVTHKGLHTVAKNYIEAEFKKVKGIKNLNLYLLTEADTSRLIDDILVPAIGKYRGCIDGIRLHEIFGVDGEYGRHYTFLKAIAAFWKVFIDRAIEGTFKIDLDQVFPQKELLQQTGASAFEHLTSPLWGAEGIDSQGKKVELGMIAGSLVNEKDISRSLFYPDVLFPADEIKGDRSIFFSPLLQALSTEAEMMTRYHGENLDGQSSCIQRIHVTGGTCGIRIDSLRKYRPFTLVYMGRAEDQAYILSVLCRNSQKNLRYLHKDGLIMRHDKEAFAGDAIEAVRIGKLIGDYARILLFSYYAQALPWPVKETKEITDPFTGCFVSRIPFTVVYLSLTLKAASFFVENRQEDNHQGMCLLQLGSKRLYETIQELKKIPNPLIKKYHEEKSVWDTYYDILDLAEKNLQNKDAFALELQKKARDLMEDCRIVSQDQ
jgi:hypothetical protein